MATKKPTTEIVSWEEELASMATEAATMEQNSASGGTFLSTKGGKFSYKDNPLGNELTVVVIDHILENHYYEGSYDADYKQSPVCFSFSRSEEGMSPHELSLTPQHHDCKTCPHNQYGSSNTGRGKACKNVRRLALLLVDSLDDVEGAEVVYLKVPVTSVKLWGSYVQQVANVLNRPPLGVVTTITIEDDAKSQFKVCFSLDSKIEDGGLIKQLMEKKKAITDDLPKPYKQPEEEPVRKPVKKNTPVKRKF